MPTTFFTGTVDVPFPGTELVISHVCTENWTNLPLHLGYSVALMFVQVCEILYNLEIRVLEVD